MIESDIYKKEQQENGSLKYFEIAETAVNSTAFGKWLN